MIFKDKVVVITGGAQGIGMTRNMIYHDWNVCRTHTQEMTVAHSLPTRSAASQSVSPPLRLAI